MSDVREEFAAAYVAVHAQRGATLERGREVWDALNDPSNEALVGAFVRLVGAIDRKMEKAKRDAFERENACDKCGGFGFGCYCGGRQDE